MKRRLFIGLACALTVGGALGRWRAANRAAPPRPPGARSASALAGLAPTRTVGEAYLWNRRDGLDAEELYRKIAPVPGAAPAATHARWLRTQVERDFAEQRMVNVGGWFLSDTEAAASALVAMS